MTKKFLIAATAIGLATPALADEPVTVIADSDLPQARIVYGDLNLANEAGLSALKQRVRGAAKDMCLTHNLATLSERAQRQTCYITARADGYAQADALHVQGKQGLAFAVGASITIGAR